MKFPKVSIGRAQVVAAVMLSVLLGECLYVISRQRLTEADYSYARCGREMWEGPNAVPGYFTTCGNISDGTLAYRVASLPLTVQRHLLAFADRRRNAEQQNGAAAGASDWELRHEMHSVLLLEHLPFALFAVWLGGGLWWVARRLFGNEGGAFALALYCVNPVVIRFATVPNNDLLACWGLYGTVYTAIGVAHAMQGPPRKWRPRIALLAVALGLTACAHVLAAVFGLVAALVLMLYVAERNREAVLAVLGIAAAGAALILFASYDFSLGAFGYVFRGGAARFWASWQPARAALLQLELAPVLLAVGVAALVYVSAPRSRYFGNTAPLLITLLLLPLVPTGVHSQAWFWAVPFALTFAGGVWADALESKQRKAFLAMCVALIVGQALLTAAWLHGLS